MNPKTIAEKFHGLPLHLDSVRGVAALRSLVELSREQFERASVKQSEDGGDDDGDIEIRFRDFFTPRPGMTIGEDGIAKIAVQGVLSNGLAPIWEKLGLATQYTTISSEISGALSGGAKGILLATDSPGGSSVGGAELVEQIRSLRIPCASHTAACMASAAYHIGSAAGQVFASDSSMVGSIGSIIVFYDWSKFYQEYGVEPVVIASGDLKGTGVEGTSLTDDQREYLKGLVIQSADRFKVDVRADRARAGEIAEDSMRGQMFFSGEAQERSLIDAIASESEVRSWLVAQASS